jgi:hypothetical protein
MRPSGMSARRRRFPVKAYPSSELAGANPNSWSPFDHNPFLTVPGAPLMKDLDSFTDATGAGSFDSIPAAETDEQGYPILPLSEARISLVSAQDKDAYVLSWLKGLPRCTPQASSTAFFTHDSAPQHRQYHHHHHQHLFNHHYHQVPTLKRPRSVTEYEEYRPRRPRTRSCPSSRMSDSIEPD